MGLPPSSSERNHSYNVYAEGDAKKGVGNITLRHLRESGSPIWKISVNGTTEIAAYSDAGGCCCVVVDGRYSVFSLDPRLASGPDDPLALSVALSFGMDRIQCNADRREERRRAETRPDWPDIAETVPDPLDLEEEACRRIMLASILLAAEPELSGAQISCIRLYASGFSYADIARLQGVSRESVRKRCDRIWRKLREAAEALGYGDGR